MTPTLTAGRANEFLPVLEARLPDKTLRHVVSVTETMLAVQQSARISEDQAVAAGLLHDLCKPMSPDGLLQAAKDYGLPISPLQGERPGLLHGPVAAEEARRNLRVTDPDVYDAIFWHTTGKADWNDVGVALYFADFAEPLRPRPEAAEARAILERDGYPDAVRYVVDTKQRFVEAKYGLDPADREFRAWIMNDWNA